jgi:N-acetylmuramoyl-L-alanine amidase
VRANASPCLNVRPSPDTEADAFDCISVGSQVTGIGTAPYWRQIRLADGRTGWAAKKYLEASSPPVHKGRSILTCTKEDRAPTIWLHSA